MNYKSRIIKKASAAIVARLVMRYIPIIIKRLGKTIGPGGVAKLVDAVVQFITSKSKVGEQDARSAAEQYLKEHPEVIQELQQNQVAANNNNKIKTSGWKGELSGGVAGSVAGSAVGGALGSVVPVVGTGIGGAIGGVAGGMVGGAIGDKAGDAMDKDTMYKKYSPQAQEFISSKIKVLKEEGYKQDQAVAIAINMAKDKGLQVPEEK